MLKFLVSLPFGWLIPWFFALNHTHYARWFPVHLRDIKLLPALSPSTEAKF